MTLLLSCQSIKKSFGSRQLFKDISFGIFKGDKIGIIGPNGSGKSTLLKILAGLVTPDSGSVTGNRGLRVGYIPQESIFSQQSLEEIVVDSLANETCSLEEKQTRAAIILSKLGFKDHSVLATSLSGGWKKRLDMAKELVKSPDILLFDEPTNHLDLEGILWLEKFLENAPFAYMVITHDRYFLENIANKMIELNSVYPKGIFSSEGSYSEFLERREEFIKGQKQIEYSLSSKVRREIEWLKQNPKARTTKSTARINEANVHIQNLKELKNRNRQSKNQFEFSVGDKQTQKMLVATNLSKSMGGKTLFSGLNLTLSPGLRLGIVGMNGSGKTTLLRLLKGELAPDKGTIKIAEGIKIVYFDQNRDQISPNISLRQALAKDGENVYYRGKSIHVNSWCKKFLFSPDRLDLPFGKLSGGEKARVHIARLMAESADVLLLDEPTNDLDIPTLEILEESLKDFPGALVVISHDRYMLDQISNLFLGLGVEDSDNYFFADFRQWEEFQDKQQSQSLKLSEKKSSAASINYDSTNDAKSSDIKPKKLSYNEKRESEQLEKKILETEEEIKVLQIRLQEIDPLDTAALQEACSILGTKQSQLDQMYKRWDEILQISI